MVHKNVVRSLYIKYKILITKQIQIDRVESAKCPMLGTFSISGMPCSTREIHTDVVKYCFILLVRHLYIYKRIPI